MPTRQIKVGPLTYDRWRAASLGAAFLVLQAAKPPTLVSQKDLVRAQEVCS